MNKQNEELIFYQKKKGQSAIEYLMTYGWMLLVVAIVGGAIFATVSGQCLNDTTGFTGSTAEVSDYATTQDSLQVEVQNNGANSLDEVAVALSDGDDVLMAGRPNSGVSVGSEQTFRLNNTDINFDADGGTTTIDTTSGSSADNITQVEACNDYDLTVYFVSDDFEGAVQTASGSIQGNFEPNTS